MCATRSAAGLCQRRTLVRRDVIGLVAPDLVLRISLGGVVRVSLVVEIAGVHADDRAADTAGFRVPGDVIADFEFGWHGGAGAAESVVIQDIVWLFMHPGTLCPFRLRPAIQTTLRVRVVRSIGPMRPDQPTSATTSTVGSRACLLTSIDTAPRQKVQASVCLSEVLRR